MLTSPNCSTILDAQLEAGRGDHVAAITADGRRVTYAELHGAMSRVAGGLAGLGVRREDRILLVLDDTPAFPATFLGAMRIGGVPIPVNFLARPDDIGYYLDDSYAVAAVVDAAFLDKVGPQVAARSNVQLVVANGEVLDGAVSLDEWLAGPDVTVDPVATHPEDMAFWLYSSGSTGRPKGVVHLHTAIPVTCEQYGLGIVETTPDDVHFSTTKMYHAYGLGNSLSFPFWVGATSVYLTGRPTPDRILARITETRPSVFFSVPTLYAAMLADPGLATTDFSSIRRGISAAEALPAAIWRRFRDETGVEILDGIGSTEMLHIYCSNRAGRVVPGTSGIPVPGYEVEIRDIDGRLLGPGQAGELWVKGESALAAYWHQRAKTKASLHGAWFRSGDRYHRDEAGNFAYEGRVDDMMKVGGLWVSPVEIEARLVEHAGVREAAVVGVNEAGLTRIKAFVILHDSAAGGEALVGELQEWCKAALQRYQYPHRIEFVEDFPRTPTGKIQRFLLR